MARPAQDGVTGLFLAAQNGHMEVARLLLDWGAGVDVATQVHNARVSLLTQPEYVPAHSTQGVESFYIVHSSSIYVHNILPIFYTHLITLFRVVEECVDWPETRVHHHNPRTSSKSTPINSIPHLRAAFHVPVPGVNHSQPCRALRCITDQATHAPKPHHTTAYTPLLVTHIHFKTPNDPLVRPHSSSYITLLMFTC